YALPGIPHGQLHVVSAWVKPGKTTFTCDGPLPSDHDGRALSIAAMVIALAIIVAWSRRRWRWRTLLWIAMQRRRALGLVRPAITVGLPIVLVIVVGRSCVVASRPVAALRVGSGIRGTADVEARAPGGTWQTCGYGRVVGEYRCGDLATVQD